MSDNGTARRKKRGWRFILLILLVLLMLLVLLFGWSKRANLAGLFGFGGGRSEGSTNVSPSDTTSTGLTAGNVVTDSATGRDTAFLANDTSLDAARHDARGGAANGLTRPVADRFGREGAVDSFSVPESRDTTVVSDSGNGIPDSLEQQDFGATQPPGPCELDTVPPWVYPDPSGGLYRKTVYVKLVADEPCEMDWRFGKGPWVRYDGAPVEISAKTVFEYRAVDSCGNRFGPREKKYEISRDDVAGLCPENMELVTIGATRFCIDRFEWPNQYKALPSTYVSIYQAKDSCSTVGKRLCTAEEWKLACGGPYGWAYPYGQVYEDRACASRDSSKVPSGTRRECRGYFDVYDMSGNVFEWTDTRAAENRQFYYVMGGFWESGPQSGCASTRYSYFPQNRHNPVGFRCCRDVGKAKENE